MSPMLWYYSLEFVSVFWFVWWCLPLWTNYKIRRLVLHNLYQMLRLANASSQNHFIYIKLASVLFSIMFSGSLYTFILNQTLWLYFEYTRQTKENNIHIIPDQWNRRRAFYTILKNVFKNVDANGNNAPIYEYVLNVCNIWHKLVQKIWTEIICSQMR